MGKTFKGRTAFGLGTAACAFVLASSAKVRADPREAPIIPSPEQKSVEASAALPLPYEPWSGTGHAPPPALSQPDAPPPLARARELPRRLFELSAALTALLPSCGSGHIDDRDCLSARSSGGVDAALSYRVSPFFSVGLEGLWGGVVNGAGNTARFGGVLGRLYFADAGAWDPYLAVTIGAGTLTLPGERDARATTSGLGGRVAGGIDYLFGSHARVGASASFAHFVSWREQRCAGGVCRDERLSYGRVLGFATLGVRLTASFGDKL
jgi:hypothetical protein